MENDEEESVLKVDVETLRAHGLELIEFLFIELIGRWGYGHSDAMDLIGTVGIDADRLEREGWIKQVVETREDEEGNEIKAYSVEPRSRFLEMIGEMERGDKKSPLRVKRERQFDELFGLFPLYGGERPLRTKREGTKEYEECKKKYLKILQRYSHDHVIDCLKAEMKWRRDNNKFQFMRKLKHWLNQREFELFEAIKDQYSRSELEGGSREPSKKDLGHGEQLR